MAHEFEELALDVHNYPTWALDVKISLAFRGILPTLSPPCGTKSGNSRDTPIPNPI
jgi:hypothetical protein